MSLRIKTTIQTQEYFLDLYKDEPLNMSLSFAEITDVTQKNSAFSQSFTIPGTKNNNEIFDFYYNLNALPINFDPNKKFPAIITWDGYEIMFGNIRLNQVTIDGDEVQYSITFYNQVGDLAANIKDKFLRDTDLTDLSYKYIETVIPFCQLDPNLVPLANGIYGTNYSYQNGKTWWGLYNIGYNYISGNSVDYQSTPLVQFTELNGLTYSPKVGYFDYSGTPVNDFYFKPTIQVKTLYEHIVNQAGYNIKSDFFKTSYFEKIYMPLKFLDDTVYPQNAIPVCYEVEGQNYNQYSSPNIENDLMSSGLTCDNYKLLNTGWTPNTLLIPIDYIGTYEFQFTYTLNTTGTTESLQKRCIINTGTTYANLYFQYVSLSPTPPPVLLKSTSFCTNPITDTNTVPKVITFTQQFIFTGNTNFRFYFDYQNCSIADFSMKIINAPRFLQSGQTIDFQIEFPENDYKQIDFITSINRYFNLIVVPDPDVPTNLIIEPMIDYIGKGQVLDWTSKIDHLQPMQITPTSSFINGTFQFEFKLDQDYANQNYQKASNRIFGTRKQKLNNDYKDDVTKFDYMFGSPLDITIVPVIQNQLTLSSFSKINQTDKDGQTIQTFVPFKILPRLIFRGLTIPNDNYGYVANSASTIPYQLWYHREFGSTFSESRFTETNRFTSYPFNYQGFSHYLNWQGYDKTTIQPAEYTFPTALDLYKIYYKDYVEDLTSKENKLFAAKIYLKPNEIKALKFNEKILVDNTYFRINKISNYNLLESSICDIELIKLTKEYTPHPILYYDFISCTGGTTYHSNSDLNYNMYAYIGNYVKLFDDSINYLGCYEVKQGEYDTGYTYQHLYIASAYTDNGVFVYPDCYCTGRTAFDVVQNGDISVNPITPSPTPTPYPTPTPTQVVYAYAGTTDGYASSTAACINQGCGRPYYRNAPSWAIGEVVYDDSSLSLTVEGNDKWFAIATSTGTYCGGGWAAIKINASGVIVDFYSCP